MTTQTTTFQQTLDGTTTTSDTFDPVAGGQRLGFTFGIEGTFVGFCRLQASFDSGVTWIDFLVLDQPDLVAIPSQAPALWRASWAGGGDYTSGSATIGFLKGGTRAAGGATRLATKDRQLVGDDNPLPAGLPQVTTTTATIANGASLSGAVDLGKTRLARIVIPASWTTANLTFQASPDGVTYNDLYDAQGGEYTVVVGGASRSILVAFADFLSVRYLKVRSGTTGTPVNQGGSRVLTLVLVR